MTTEPQFDLHGAFPFSSHDDASNAPEFHTFTLAEKPFLYIGQALTRAEFAKYVAQYDFGTIPPSYIVYHHTAIPSTLAAKWPGAGAVWDAGEEGLSAEQIKAKRLRQLGQIRDFYAKEKGWDRGPHVFVDDRWIYLFTPLAEIGIHAGIGNSTHISGRLVYGIGCEVVGYYERVVWPEAVRRNAGFVAAALQRRLGTFELRAGAQWHDLTSHRQYGKPSCPGAAITEQFYVQAALEANAQLDVSGEVKALSVHPKLLGAWQLSGGIWLKDRLTPGLPVAPAFVGKDGMLYQVFERSVARLKADGGVDWLLLTELAALVAPMT